MKPIHLILLCLLLTGCLKANIAPTSSKDSTSTIKADILNNHTNIAKADAADTYDWYNGTKGTALIKVTCNDCNAMVTIGNVTTPFLFNEQGVGQLKYTPVSGMSVYIAVCPGSVKTMKVDVFDAANTVLYTYTGVTANWSNTYIIK
jgi:hypothetical protein